MEKKTYEALKSLRMKVAGGTATFLDRTALRIIEKKIKKGMPFTIKQPEAK